MRLSAIATLIAATCLISPLARGQQRCTVGPVPPPGTDRGLRAPGRDQVVLASVPAYLWHHGCGPTTVGMILGYWDRMGYVDLVPGDADQQTAAVNAMIADDGGTPNCALPDGDHYQDYSCPRDDYGPLLPDRSETGGAHASDCVADFMRTSWSSALNQYGWSWGSDVVPAFLQYVGFATSYVATGTARNYNQWSWAAYRAEIDAGRPVGLLVDSDGDGHTDHFIAAIGYDPATTEYACRDTWDTGIHWYPWRGMSAGNPWGIYAAYLFNFTYPDPASSPGIANLGSPGLHLSRVSPNPARDRIDFRLDLARAAAVEIVLADVSGRVVRSIPASVLPAGSHAMHVDLETAGAFPRSGVYYLYGRAEGRSEAVPIVIIR